MNMYKQYLEERTPGSSVEFNDHGFATYHIKDTQEGKECYIEDIYVEPDYRNSKEASKLANIIIEKAKKAECNFITGSVVPTANGATASIKVLFGYGFKVWLVSENMIWFKIDL